MSNNILLTVYTYVDGVSDTPFPNAGNPLKIKYTYNAQRMGGSSLTATAMYPTCLDDLWVSGKQYVDFKGERYFIVKTPSSSKSNDDVRYKHELEFLSGRSVLDNVYVYDVVTGDAGNTDRYVSNSTKVLFYGDIQEFVARLNFSLEYSNLAYRIVIDEGITSEAKQVSLENVFFSNALQEIFNIFELPFYFVGTTIHVGFTNNAITHTFKYGKDFELLSVSKTNANYKITNRVTGTGSSDNIQFYYPNPSNDRKAIEEAGGTWITPSQVLMPPIYRQTNGAERFYNALNNKYINPDTGDYYTFENLYLPTNPKEQIVDFSYIKPSIKNALNKAGVRMDVIKAIAFDQNDDDSINKDTGEYVHSYFYVKLNKFDGDFGFNLFDQALVGSDATVSMTSGACGACNFQIGVTEITQEGKQVFRNPVQVDSKGDIVPGDYAQKVNVNNLQPQQQNTMTNEVWIALKKDNTTFGIVMPNAGNNIKPSAGDSFVFLNIDMPQAYITKAEKELEEAIIKYMANNNREKFTFSIKLSRIFLAENPSIGNLLNENARINLEYNGQFHQLYVSNYTLKVDENVLPEISIQLTDTLTIGKNSLQTAIDGVKQDIMNSIGSVDFLKQGLKYFLRKDTSDYARDFITFLRGLKVGSYTEGGNSGGIFAVDANGKTYIETDMLKVRAKAYFETLEIINTNSIGGRQIITPGGSITCNKVVEGDTYYRCYFVNDADNTPIENRFKVDDQALSQDFNIKEGIYENVSNHYYWRKVVAIGEDYIDLSKTDADVSSDIPKAGDVICQLGNKTDKTRQNAIIFSAVDFYSPSITLYAGIDSYSYVNKEYVSYGVDKTTNEAFFNVYGRMYVGDRNKTSYMQYSEKDGLQIKGKLQVGTTIGSGQTVEDALEQTKNDAIAGAKENLDEFATTVNGSLKDLQDQIDGAIETWFYDPVPTLTNQPAVNWTTDKDKNTHLGDLYYDGNGKAYRFQLTGATYEWKVITDSDITKALADAKKAQDTADSKRKIFVRQPLDTETYEVGDLWVNATFGSTYSNDVLRCKTAKAAGTSFSINHWEKASKYTDDQAALEAQRLAKAAQADVDQAKRDINGLDGEVDGLRNFTDQAFKDGVIDRSEATAIAKYLNNIETSQKDVSQSFAKVYNNPLLSGIAKTNLNNANIAFNTAATDLISTIRSAIADGITTNTEKAAVDDKYSVFNTKYGDYIAYLNEANKFIQDQIKTTADNALQKAIDLNYLKQAFKEETTITDGVVQTSILALGYTDGSSYKIMSGSNGIYDSSKIGGGIASWWGGSMKDRNDYTSENMPSDVAKGLVRFDGTGYFANGNLWWDNNGKLHADPLSFFVGPENVGDLLSIFQIVKSGSSISYVIPRYPFQKLSISSYLELGNGYRIKVDEANNAIYVEKDGGGIVNFYATGGITALGAGTKSPQTILDALPIDTNTLSKEGGKLTVIGGGSGGNTGAISLNGQRYDSVDGVITLPVASNNKAFNEGIAYVKSDGIIEIGNRLDFHDPHTTNQDYDYRLHQVYDNGAVLIGSGKFRATEIQKTGGTASQFLKADGSVDSNLYALAYGGDQNSIQYSSKSNYLRVIDRRNDTILPTSYDNYNISGLFHMSGMPSSNWWSGIHVKGWGEGYATWELVGPSSTDNTNNRLYYRDGKGSSWATDWKGIAFLEDCNKVATPYFEGQNIHSDYGWWVVALCKLSPADSEYNYASGTMFYRRGNGIYGNGSVNFSVMKKYGTTNVYAGVIYNGFGVSTDEDAPKLCTFTYGGVKYCGLKWTGAASLDNIKTLIYDISSTGLPFYVKYFNSQSGEVFNAEIKNSIVELGSDIILYNTSTPCGLFTSSNKGLEIKAKDNAWAFTRYNTNGRIVDTGLSGTTAGLAGQTGNYEIRPGANNNEGVFVRYYQSDYGKLGVVNKSGQQCSISYFNNAPTGDYPLWTVGAGIRNQYSFDWWYHNQGYKATLDSEGKLFVNVRVAGNPYYSLTIGDYDTGLHWQADGIIEFRSNTKQVGYWGYTNGRLYNTYFREPTGNGYAATSMMVNGNGSNLYPGIGFHQPGVTAGVVYFTNSGEFKFRNITDTGYTNVYGGNLIADAGFLYSRYNGIEIKIGAENDSYVHFITKPARSLYFANSLFVNGSVLPYSSSTYSLGDAGHLWNYVYGNHFMGNSASATYILPNYVGGQQANPQTYFNNSMGVKVAMTGVNPDSYWGDTLWINGYGGTDVPDMCALHFSRGGAPLIYISSQKYHATSYGTMYHIWTGYNSNHSSAAWTCSTLNANGRISTTSDIYSAGWVRAGGSNGFYCESYGGGIHMTDSTWVRVYNGKQFYVSSTSSDAIHTAGGINASGRIYAGGHLSTNGGLAVSGIYGCSGASGFNVYASFYGNAQHGGIEIGASDNVFGIGVHSNDHMYWWWTYSGSVGSSSNKSYIMDYGGGSWSFTGNILATGGITASGRIYAGGHLSTNGGLAVSGIYGCSGASGFNVYASFYGNAQHGGIEIGASDNVFGIGVHSNDHMYWWWTYSGSVGSSSNKSYIMDYGGGSWSFTGNILATGGITAKTTSDMRLKNRVGQTDYAKKLLSLGLVFDYIYNDTAQSRIDKMVDDKRHIGLSYQAVSKVLPAICGKDDDGYGYINYISPDFISLLAGATQLNTLGIKELCKKTNSIEYEIKKLKKENECLKKEINKLKREYR